MVPKLTEAGAAILLKALSGTAINFTKMQLGNGESQVERRATALNNPLITVPFTKIEVSNSHAALTAAFNNSAVESGFRVTEIGFFVEDPDNEENEILYALGIENNSTADFVPGNTNRVLEMEFEALIFVGDAENVTAAINSSLVYVSKKEFETHTGNSNNPHNVTKKQVGLGNVPNVSTNNQTPTYTEITTLSELSSGEKVSTLLSKIALAVKKLIAHLNNNKNPHNVTAKDVGAAETAHTHGASDINSGTLSITRGGTGANSAVKALENLGAGRVYHGSYVGNGKAGLNDPNMLTFSFTPVLIVISRVSNSDYTVSMLNGVTSYNFQNGIIIARWGEKSLSWYGSLDPDRQLNATGEEYRYVAIG